MAYIYRGWRVALAGTMINFLVGINYTWSIYATGLVAQKNWSYAEASLPYSVFLLCYAVCMVFAGRAQDYYGPGPVVRLGSLFSGGAFLVSLFLLNFPFTAALTWGILLGMGAACCFASTTPAAMKWFSGERKGTVAGLVVAGIGLSALVLSPVIQYLVEKSAAGSFLISGLFLLAGMFLLGRVIENPPLGIKELRRQLSRRNRYPVSGDYRLYLLWFMFFLTTGSGVTMAAHLNNIALVQAGMEQGFIAVSLFALGNTAGRAAAGIFSDRVGRWRAMLLVFSGISLMLVVLITARFPAVFILVVFVLAFCFGGLFSLFPAMVVHLFGEEDFGLNYGIVFTGLGAAGVFPFLTGVLFELQGDYLTAYMLLLGGVVVALLLLFKLGQEGDV